MDVKQTLEQKAAAGKNPPVRLTKSMTIVDMVKVLEPEIRRALPAVLTPERFTRMALSAVNNTPELADCTPMSFMAALMNAAQLGLGKGMIILGHNRTEEAGMKHFPAFLQPLVGDIPVVFIPSGEPVCYL